MFDRRHFLAASAAALAAAGLQVFNSGAATAPTAVAPRCTATATGANPVTGV